VALHLARRDQQKIKSGGNWTPPISFVKESAKYHPNPDPEIRTAHKPWRIPGKAKGHDYTNIMEHIRLRGTFHMTTLMVHVTKRLGSNNSRHGSLYN